MKLLFRRQLTLTFDGPNDINTVVTASFYRRSIDSGYQALMARKAEEGTFDCYILRQMNENCEKGIVTYYINPLYL